MSIFKKLSQKLKENIQVEKTVLQSVQENQEQIIKLNTDEQLFRQGIDSENKKLTHKYKSYPIYSASYEALKKRKGKYQGYIDLSLKGDYLKGFELKLFDNYFVIESPEIALEGGYDLAEILRDNYGEKTEGLTPENIQKVAEIILNDFQKQMFDAFKLSISQVT
jgi:hypothetical protein